MPVYTPEFLHQLNIDELKQPKYQQKLTLERLPPREEGEGGAQPQVDKPESDVRPRPVASVLKGISVKKELFQDFKDPTATSFGNNISLGAFKRLEEFLRRKVGTAAKPRVCYPRQVSSFPAFSWYDVNFLLLLQSEFWFPCRFTPLENVSCAV